MKTRIYQLAKETGFSNQELIEAAQELDFDVVSAASSLTEEETDELLSLFDYPPQPKVVKQPVKQTRESKGRDYSERKHRPQEEERPSYSRFEKVPARKEKNLQVKTVSPQKANRLFVGFLLFFSAVLIGLGGIGIWTDMRVNQLVKDTNQALSTLQSENQNQEKAIQTLQNTQIGTLTPSSSGQK